tara:strand:+ start:582 stop:782 length:201 start_codon:yes stop_codon:yes gene_type:complete
MGRNKQGKGRQSAVKFNKRRIGGDGVRSTSVNKRRWEISERKETNPNDSQSLHDKGGCEQTDCQQL